MVFNIISLFATLFLSHLKKLGTITNLQKTCKYGAKNLPPEAAGLVDVLSPQNADVCFCKQAYSSTKSQYTHQNQEIDTNILLHTVLQVV